jgi:site-specific DNA-methyltransferase (adenine-specific)
MTENMLYVGDCRKIMPEWLEPESVDVCVTSPPYNLGIKYRSYSDTKKEADYLEFTREWLAEVKRVLKPDGSLFLNLGACPRSPLLPYKALLVAAEVFTLQNTIHWVKSISVEQKDGSTLSVGHFKPINSGRYLNDCHEFVFHLTKTGSVPVNRLALGVPYADKSNVKRWGKENRADRRCRGNVWHIPYDTIQSCGKQRPHPATFPAKLAEYAIRLHMADQKPATPFSVLDPFVGIGNSALGARAVIGVDRFYGIDIDESYIEETHRRTA